MRTPQRLQTIRDLIRDGDLAAARIQIREAATRKMGRDFRLELAYLANQAQVPQKAATLLHRTIWPARGTRASDATAEEKAEYGQALARIGATREAIGILASLDAAVLPRVYRFLALAYFRQWDWRTAIPLLKNCLALPDLSPSDRIYAEFYLAIALMHGADDTVGARKHLAVVLRETGPDHFRRAHWDAWQVLAQTHYLEKDWSGAIQALDRMDALYPHDPDSSSDLISRKWRRLIELHQRQKRPETRPETLAALAAIKKGFRALGNWEQVRSCDYYEAVATDDENLLVRLYCGTPFPEFRRKLLTASGRQAQDMPEHYEVSVGRATESAAAGEAPWLDGLNGENSLGRARLKPGQILQRLLAALTADLYIPPNIAQLHEGLYPGDHFNPTSSPLRVRQALKRLRQWLKANRIPLEIEEKQERYRLESEVQIRIRIRSSASEPGAPTRTLDLVERLAAQFGREAFSAHEVETLLGISRWSAVALLRTATRRQVLERIGRGPSTRYRLAAGKP